MRLLVFKNKNRFESKAIDSAFGKLLAALLVCGAMFSCAEPKYVRETQADTSAKLQQEAQGDCKYKFTQSELCLTWVWEGAIPAANAKGSLIFKTFRLNLFDQTPVEVDTAREPSLILWMPSMGHGSVPTKIERIDQGTYRVTEIQFIMSGPWELRFTIPPAGGIDAGKPDIVAVPINIEK